MSRAKRLTIAESAARQRQLVNEGRAKYAEADAEGRKLARRLGATRRTVTFIPGTTFKLVNNPRLLKEKGILYGHGAVRQWEVDDMTHAEQAKAAQAEQAEQQ